MPENRIAWYLVVEAEFLEVPVLPLRISESPLPRPWAGEDGQFATAVIVVPLNPPLAIFAILEDIGWLGIGLAYHERYLGEVRSKRRRLAVNYDLVAARPAMTWRESFRFVAPDANRR